MDAILIEDLQCPDFHDIEVPKGHWLFGVKNEETRAYRRVFALDREAAIKQLGWDPSKVDWVIPLASGLVKPPKPSYELSSGIDRAVPTTPAPAIKKGSLYPTLRKLFNPDPEKKAEILKLILDTLIEKKPGARLQNSEKQAQWYYLKLRRESG